jgi:hypothetical protein
MTLTTYSGSSLRGDKPQQAPVAAANSAVGLFQLTWLAQPTVADHPFGQVMDPSCPSLALTGFSTKRSYTIGNWSARRRYLPLHLLAQVVE